jgi:hypothetical protein
VRYRGHSNNGGHLLGMLRLRHRSPDAGLEMKSRGFTIRIFDVRIRDGLQIPQAKHVDIGCNKPRFGIAPGIFSNFSVSSVRLSSRKRS